jgi:hypothetical protein
MVLYYNVPVCRRFQHFFWPCLSRCFLSIEIVNGRSGDGVHPSLPMAGTDFSAVTLLSRYGVADAARPDGTPCKLLDVSRLAELGWRARTSLEDGIKMAYQAYLSEHQ